MLLPGISGSFILLMLKKYSYILDAIGYFKMSIVFPFLIGVFAGLIIFSRIISYLLKYFYQKTVLFITGLLIASLYVVWPFQIRSYEIIRGKEKLITSIPYVPESFDESFFYSLLMMLFGFTIVIFLSRVSNEQF